MSECVRESVSACVYVCVCVQGLEGKLEAMQQHKWVLKEVCVMNECHVCVCV